MRRRALISVSALLGAILVAPVQLASAGAASAPASPTGNTTSVVQVGDGGADEARKKKPKKKKKQAGKLPVLRMPTRALTSAAGVTNGVRVTWTTAQRATRYRVKYAFAPWDKWPAATRYSSWLPASSRSLTRTMSADPVRDTSMTALPYGNPVFTRVQAANGTKLGPFSTWRATWPSIPRPAAGDDVRFGTYNVMLAGREDWEARMPVIAQNIAARGLTVVALQETLSTDGSDVARELTALTGHPWLVAPTGQTEGRILYDASRFALTGSGKLNQFSPSDQPILSYRTGTEIPLPWARLQAIGSDKTFVVVSIHFAPADITSGPNAQSNRETGASARAVLAALDNLTDRSEPAVIAGDFAGGYGLWGDRNPAQPTLVRAGWWDSMASMSRSGVTYSTVNKLAPQTSSVAVAGRADGIFLRGIRGTTAYANVANYYRPGTKTPPSDHNLVYSAFEIPN